MAIGGVIVRGSGAKVAGSTTEINLSDITGMLTTAVNEDWEGWSWLFAIVSLFFFLCILALALIAVVFLPRQLRRIAGAIVENPWRASVWGIGGLVLIVPLAALLTISVVGIILIPLELTLAVCASLMGFVAVAHLIGRVALSAKKRAEEKLLREALWGLVILWLIGWIPYLGWLVKVCAVVLGLGGTLMTRFGTDQPPVAPAAPLPGEAPSAAAGPGTEEPQVAH